MKLIKFMLNILCKLGIHCWRYTLFEHKNSTYMWANNKLVRYNSYDSSDNDKRQCIRCGKYETN